MNTTSGHGPVARLVKDVAASTRLPSSRQQPRSWPQRESYTEREARTLEQARRNTSRLADGRRPAVAWVASLPRRWVSDSERLVLLFMACDSFDGLAYGGGADVLAHWVGMYRSSVADILKRLSEPTETRPALIARGPFRDGRRLWIFLRTAGHESAGSGPAPQGHTTAEPDDVWPGTGPAPQGHTTAEPDDVWPGTGPAVVRPDRATPGPAPQGRALSFPKPLPASSADEPAQLQGADLARDALHRARQTAVGEGQQ